MKINHLPILVIGPTVIGILKVNLFKGKKWSNKIADSIEIVIGVFGLVIHRTPFGRALVIINIINSNSSTWLSIFIFNNEMEITFVFTNEFFIHFFCFSILGSVSPINLLSNGFRRNSKMNAQHHFQMLFSGLNFCHR
jgi:hypothetical protein